MGVNNMYGRPCKGTALGVLQKNGEMRYDEVTGTFVSFGVNYDNNDELSPFSTAILEDDNGYLHECRMDGFRFLDRGPRGSD